MINWLLSPNVLMAGLIVVAGVRLWDAGRRHEARRVAAETAALNSRIVAVRAKDEVELAVAAAHLSQTCPLTEATAKLLASIK
jgi:hypothetical protein